MKDETGAGPCAVFLRFLLVVRGQARRKDPEIKRMPGSYGEIFAGVLFGR